MERSVDAFAARLEQRLRSGKKIDAGPTSPPSTAERDLDRLAASAEETAALSGRFDPSVLLAASEPSTRLAVLSRLASSSVVETAGTSTKWLLHADRRTDVLKRLHREQRLDATLAGPLPPTDRFGEKLREVLRDGASMQLAGLSRDELLATAAAIEATRGLDMPKPDACTVRQSIAELEFLSDYGVLLQDGFIGRTQELEELRSFVADTAIGTYGPLSGLVLAGLGGAGKSTLLATFARECVVRKMATVAILDFDQPGIEPNDTSWLEMEITRQVSCQHAETAAELRSLRQETRHKKEIVDEQIASYASQRSEYDRGLRQLMFDLQRVLTAAGHAERPLLLVLDTFEEVTQRDLEGHTLEWLKEIVERLWPIRLKVIFSGRLFDQSRELLKSHGITRVLEIDELEPAHAEQLLLQQHVPPAWAKRLSTSDVLPRRPLELKLLARLVSDDSAPSLEDLEREVRNGGEAARRLFAGLVYRRVLLRIKSETTRTLAYPGLVLRYVTADLIRNVLAPAVELPPMDDAQAIAALNDLASYDWLAYRGPDGEVWHRKDLRRSVLQAMLAQEPEKTSRIHQQAIQYFSQRTTARDRAEETYHRLMRMRSPDDGASIDLHELKQAQQYIGADAVDLPPSAAALLRLGAGMDLSVGDVALLPAAHLLRAYTDKGQRLVNDREFGTAYHLYRDVHAKGLLTGVPVREWEIEAAFTTASWRTAAPDAQPSLAPLHRAIFPAAVIEPGRVDRARVIALLQSDNDIASLFRDSSASTTIERVVFGVVLLNAEQPLSDVERNAAAVLLRSVRSSVKPITAGLEQRLLLLDALVASLDWRELAVPLSAITMPIDEPTLDRLNAAARDDEPSGKAVHALVSAVRDARMQSVSGRWTVRSMLGAVNGLTTNAAAGDVRVPLAPLGRDAALKLLSTPVPELRDPCRFALLDAFADPDGLRLLGEMFAAIVSLRLNDLEPDAFVAAVSTDPEHTLESYVEAADRCGALTELLARARAARPGAEKLTDVEAAANRWTAAVNRLFRREP